MQHTISNAQYIPEPSIGSQMQHQTGGQHIQQLNQSGGNISMQQLMEAIKSSRTPEQNQSVQQMFKRNPHLMATCIKLKQVFVVLHHIMIILINENIIK